MATHKTEQADEQLARIAATLGSSRSTATQMVREVLRRAIISCQLPSGSKLHQSDIAQQLGVSITPVREAIRDLATEGLVDTDAWRGIRVHAVTEEELEEIYELRAFLEVQVMRRACERITSEMIEDLHALTRTMRGVSETSEWLILNEEFHEKIARSAQSNHMASYLSSVRRLVSLYIGLFLAEHPDVREQSDADHELMVQALEQRDIEAATVLVAHHMDRTLRADSSLIAERRSQPG